MYRLIIIHTILLVMSSNAFGVQIDPSSATALNTVTLYADSTFVEETKHVYKEGAFFKVIKESYFEHTQWFLEAFLLDTV